MPKVLRFRDLRKKLLFVVIHTPDTDEFMIALSKKIELDCQLYIKTGTESPKRTIDINVVAHCVNHNINKTDCDIDTFLKALLAFHCFTGCDSTGFFAGKGKLRPLSLLSSSENCIYGSSQVGTFRTVTEDIERILEKFICEMYGKKQRIQIYKLMKLGKTSTVIGTEEYHLRCYHPLRLF